MFIASSNTMESNDDVSSDVVINNSSLRSKLGFLDITNRNANVYEKRLRFRYKKGNTSTLLLLKYNN